MAEGDEDNKENTVYYDGDCPMCRAFVAKLEPSSSETDFKSFRSEALPESIAPEQAERYMHLVDADGRTYRGADAALKLLERRRGFRLFAKLFQLPGLVLLARLVYRFIAANRLLIFGVYQRHFFTKLLLVLGFLVPLIITRRLWLSEHFRFYPLTPAFARLPEIPYPLDVACYLVMAVLLCAIGAAPRARPWILGFVTVTTLYSLWDWSRWMPYNYQFVVMLCVLSQLRWDSASDSEERRARVLNTLALVVFSIWFWSGVHKVNARYHTHGFPWMMSPFTGLLPEALGEAVLAFSVLTPLLEAGGALLLLFQTTRALGVACICAMHLFILLTFGPLGLSFNHSVWSWNVVQIGFCLLFFWRRPRLNWRDIIFGNGLLHRVVFFFFLLMPVGNYFDVWDDFLSHALYSWSTMEAEVELKSAAAVAEVPAEAKPAVATHKDRSFIHLLNWSYLVFESPPYHSRRVFLRIFDRLCTTMEHKADIELQIFGRPHWRTGRSAVERYGCSDAGPVQLSPPGAAG